MTEEVWKYELPPQDSFALMMPVGAKILIMQEQGGQPCIWARVNPEAAKEIVPFYFVETGESLPSGEGFEYEYVGTRQTGAYIRVLHLFRERPVG